MNWPKHINVLWRAGNCSTTIVCDELAADALPGCEDRAYYKGYLLGESMAPSTIQHLLLLHNTWLMRQNGKARNQWADDAAKKIAHDVIVHEIREEGIKAIILEHAPVEIEDGTASCGHPAQYLYSEDGGKHIICLVCERKYGEHALSNAHRDLQAMRIRLDATEKAYLTLCDAVVRNKADLLNIQPPPPIVIRAKKYTEVVALVKQARAFLAEMAARTEDDEGTSAEKLREALKPFEDVEP